MSTYKNKKDIIWGYAMVAPAILGLIILNIIPFFDSIYTSFMKTDGLSVPVYIGFDNYERLFANSEVITAIGNTFLFAVLSVPFGIALGLIFAVLLNSKIKAKGFFRTVFFSPMVVAPAAIAMIWSWIFNSNFGILNYFLSIFGIEKISWLTDPKMVIPSLAIVSIWSSIGYNLVLFLAGLQGIGEHYYEAAAIDGAGPIRCFFHITLPLVSPMMFFVMITSVMNAIKLFDLFYVMIGPSNPTVSKTQTILYLFYSYAFRLNEKGYASAIVVLVFFILLFVTAFQFWYQKKWVHYD